MARRTLAWELGGRDDATCRRLLDKVGVEGNVFLTDDWEGFHRLIPEEQLFTGKDLTFPIEQDNSDVRHHLARFRRRSKVTSRARHMVDGALRLLCHLRQPENFLPMRDSFLSIFALSVSASHGNALNAINKLNEAAKGDPATNLAPTITPQQANLARITMLRDMLEGLRHVQETAGMTHLDVKAPNFFIDANGVTKLGDFGTARTGTAHQLDKNPIDNPTWQAPELLKGTDRRAEVVTAFDKMNRAAAAAARAEIDRTLSEADQDVARKNIKDAQDARQERQVAAHAPKIGITAKADTWAVGIDAYRLFTNVSPFEMKFQTDEKDKIKAFGDDPNNRVRLPDGVPPGLDGLARSHLNTVLGQLMHPDPAQRPTLSQILQNPLFQLAGVGGQAARDVIKQVTT